MNPFQAHFARTNTAAKSLHMHPAALHGVMGATLAAGVAPMVGGVIDTTVGDTHGFNSGEIPLNYLIAGLGTGITMGGAYGSEYINSQLDDRFKESKAASSGKASAHDAEIKAKIKEIHKTKGVEAAQQFYADHKNSNSTGATVGTYTEQGAKKRRMAGALLSALVGAGVSLPMMVDASY